MLIICNRFIPIVLHLNLFKKKLKLDKLKAMRGTYKTLLI